MRKTVWGQQAKHTPLLNHARIHVRELVESRIGEPKLRKNSVGQYDHNDIMTLQKGIENDLGSQWNVLTPGKGANMLLHKTPNVLTKIKETDVIDTNSVLKTSKMEPAKINMAEPDATPVTAKMSGCQE